MKIKFDLKGDNRPYVEGVNDYETSMFHSQYQQAFSLVDSYLKGRSTDSKISESIKGSIENCNNIFVFDGDRGTGKTSCMLSVANMLTDENHKRICADYPHVASMQFETIAMMDPSFFDKDHIVLSMFVSRLYRAFLDKDEDANLQCLDKSCRQDLVAMFMKVQQQLRSIFGEKFPKDGLEYLVNMAAAIDIREAISKLVKLYLSYIGKPDATLILMVDDIDIDDTHAEEMAEQLRKYFMQPNIVVLVSLKIDQLAGILVRNMQRKYGFGNRDYGDEIVDRVERYLSKLIPAHQRIYMPKAEDYINAIPEIQDPELWKYDMYGNIRLKQLIPELIFRKTRFLFYNSSKQVSYIVPRNLRDMRQMLKMLIQMPDYVDHNSNGRDAYNKEVFCRYFFNDWCDINLTDKTKKVAKSILQIKNFSEFNFIVVGLLNDYVTKKTNSQQYKDIADSQNVPFNMSIGDVIAIIHYIEKVMYDEDTKRMLFFIRSLYSISLYAAYDSITSSSEEEKANADVRDMEIHKSEHSQVHNDYESLIGGCLYNKTTDPILRNSLAGKFISVSELNQLFAFCVNDWDAAEEMNMIRLLEFIMLAVHYDSSKDIAVGEGSSYRKSVELCYDGFGVSNTLIFDIGALFFNLSRPESCFRRFASIEYGAKFISMLSAKRAEDKDPLFEDMKAITADYRQKEYKNEHERWLSFCCFRNVEIIEDFLASIQSAIIPDIADEFKAYGQYFKTMADYSIKSYDRYDDGRKGKMGVPYTINFKFFDRFADVFDPGNTALKDKFMSIFTDVKSKSDMD